MMLTIRPLIRQSGVMGIAELRARAAHPAGVRDDLKFPRPRVAATVSKRESAMIGMLALTFVLSIGNLISTVGIRAEAQGIKGNQRVSHQTGIDNRVVLCETLDMLNGSVPLPAQCVDPEVIASSGGHLRPN